MEGTRNRIGYVDIAKIAGMFLIVYGHILRGGRVTTWIYTFHVPLFFFLSGVTFHENVRQAFGYFIRKKAKCLLVPFLVWSLISTAIYIALTPIIPSQMLLETNMADTIRSILMGYCKANSPLWFLPCLFIVELLMWGIVKAELRNGKVVYLGAVAISLIVCASWPVFKEKENFWNIHNAFILLPFAISGYLFGKRIEKTDISIKNISIAAILVTGGNGRYIA